MNQEQNKQASYTKALKYMGKKLDKFEFLFPLTHFSLKGKTGEKSITTIPCSCIQ